MNIEGRNVIVKKSAKELYDYFTQLEKFKELMPENIEKFEIEGDSFKFRLKGMPEIRLVLQEKTPYSNITLASASSKFPFTLVADIEEVSENECSVQLKFNGSFNPMMAMMIKNPLTKFVNILSDNLEKF